MPFNYIELYVIPEGGGQISSVLKNELTEFLDEKIVVGKLFEFKDVTYVETTVSATIYVYSNYNANTVKTAIVEKLEEIFSLNNMELGVSLRYSQLAAELQSVSGIAYVELHTPTTNLEVDYGEILTLGTTTITIGETQRA
jgi:phage-related baseplate assembly protein